MTIAFDDDEYAAYSEWLMANAEIHILDSEELIFHLERQTRYDEFLAYRNALMARDSVEF